MEKLFFTRKIAGRYTILKNETEDIVRMYPARGWFKRKVVVEGRHTFFIRGMVAAFSPFGARVYNDSGAILWRTRGSGWLFDAEGRKHRVLTSRKGLYKNAVSCTGQRANLFFSGSHRLAYFTERGRFSVLRTEPEIYAALCLVVLVSRRALLRRLFLSMACVAILVALGIQYWRPAFNLLFG